jgi:hypothetical protein
VGTLATPQIQIFMCVNQTAALQGDVLVTLIVEATSVILAQQLVGHNAVPMHTVKLDGHALTPRTVTQILIIRKAKPSLLMNKVMVNTVFLIYLEFSMEMKLWVGCLTKT